jgi:mono/diheme cytochrome c family protein
MNRLQAWLPLLALAFAAGCAAPAGGPEAAMDTLRGGELYRTYCIACHTAQVHWRDKRLVRSWDDLLFQVSRWQRISGQDWSREEIDDVAAYLNALFYDVPCPKVGCGSSTLPLKRS